MGSAPSKDGDIGTAIVGSTWDAEYDVKMVAKAFRSFWEDPEKDYRIINVSFVHKSARSIVYRRSASGALPWRRTDETTCDASWDQFAADIVGALLHYDVHVQASRAVGESWIIEAVATWRDTQVGSMCLNDDDRLVAHIPTMTAVFETLRMSVTTTCPIVPQYRPTAEDDFYGINARLMVFYYNVLSARIEGQMACADRLPTWCTTFGASIRNTEDLFLRQESHEDASTMKRMIIRGIERFSALGSQCRLYVRHHRGRSVVPHPQGTDHDRSMTFDFDRDIEMWRGFIDSTDMSLRPVTLDAMIEMLLHRVVPYRCPEMGYVISVVATTAAPSKTPGARDTPPSKRRRMSQRFTFSKSFLCACIHNLSAIRSMDPTRLRSQERGLVVLETIFRQRTHSLDHSLLGKDVLAARDALRLTRQHFDLLVQHDVVDMHALSTKP